MKQTFALISFLAATLAPMQVGAQTDSLQQFADALQKLTPFLKVEKEEKGEYEKAFNDYYVRRINQNGLADWGAYATAFRQASAKGVPRAPGGSYKRVGPWKELGPWNLDIPYKPYYGSSRPTTGRITAAAWDPTSLTTYYVSSAGGGVWKTTDDGANWSPLSDTATWPHLQVGGIVVDPRDKNKIYAGLGDSRGFFRFYSSGVMESTDAGATWTLNATPAGNPTTRMAIDPSKGNVLMTTGKSVYYDLYSASYKAEAGKVYIKKPGGNYVEPAGLPANTLWLGCSIGAKDRNLKRTYYVAGLQLDGAGGGTMQVWAGKDGDNWQNLNVPGAAVAALGPSSGIDISASPANVNNVYVVNGNNRRVYRFDLAAATWNDITTPTFPVDLSPGDSYNWSQANYDIHISCSYTPGGNRDVLYCGLITFASSDDEGATWTDIGQTYMAAPMTHNDQHCAAYSPLDPSWVLFGNDGGVFGVKYNKTTRSWSSVLNGINHPNVAQFFHGAVAMNSKDNVIGGTQDNASPRSFGASSPNDAMAPSLGNWNNCGGGDGGWSAVDGSAALTSYTAETGELWGTTDGWTIRATGNGNASVFPIRTPFWPDGPGGNFLSYDSNSFVGAGSLTHTGATLYYAGYRYLFRYSRGNALDGNFSRFDNSASGIGGGDGRPRYRMGTDDALYQSSGTSLPRTNIGFITTVCVAPSDPATVYVGTSDGYVWVTRNATNASLHGVTFTRIDRNLPLRSINEIVVHPFDSEKVWVVLGGTGDTKDYVWHCPDTRTLFGSAPWINLDSQGLFPVCHNTIALDPKRPLSTFYVGTDVGVKMTTDAGATWSSITTSASLPNVQVNKLAASGCTSSLTAFTFGRGAWQMPVDNAAIQGFGFSPSTLKGGDGTTLRIVLWAPAPIFGATIALSPPNPYVPVPGLVFIPPGMQEAVLPLGTTPVLAPTVVSITASYAGESRVTPITLLP
ncbi:MAG: hypothetical protein JNM34_07455 [Chthonomonadaceae bacterium]|nr:hypothetical protein [Chthonomonadaceae bacterium]